MPLEPHGQVAFVASKQLNLALCLGINLPDPGPGNRYQLWTGTGDPSTAHRITAVVRDNQLADTRSQAKILFSGNITNADFLAINVEQAASRPAEPTTPVLAAGVI